MGAEPGDLAGLHILIVEDDRSARGILRDLFKYYGANVTVANSARHGLSRLRHLNPDVVVADVRLPDHNAPWLLREARSRDCDAPFVAVTGYDVDEGPLRAQGFQALLRKPLDADRLVTAVIAATRARGTGGVI